MFGTDDLNSGLDRHGNLLLHVLTGTCPLGGVIVRQLAYPVCKPDLHITIKGCNWKVLCACVCVCVCGGGGGGGGRGGGGG